MIVQATEQEGYEKLSQELRRGVVILAALSQLQTPQYGYSLIDRLTERGFSIDQGTLYPLLRRLESQGFLDSMWNVEGSRPRRYYVINQAGRTLLAQLSHDWQSLAEVMQRLLTNEGA
ncbi:MAG TPA: PadR family transcriptional regulator [Herpetosiphon sp.]|uniref:Transcriptional regulator, PadR-like family n=1 Tax=Herpetosiphon aurantiacus (strain ATCC 23779 / DSM 785 / 114-95) TaxID=316274 RepID=A9AZM1_HERA2|nr:transcriptional regulator, PadR-like family [Herpetosiphon aurantiacus DSM 785]HBW51400.1 PadR family transcriptional regulator [Herpetosiphon sp.]